MTNEWERILGQYSAPVRSWPGDEAGDDEARANLAAINPPAPAKLDPDEVYRGAFLPFRRTADGKDEWAVPGFIHDAWNAAKAIRDTSGTGTGPAMRFSQLPEAEQEQIIGHGMAGAMSGVTGGLARAAMSPKLPVGTTELGIFGGRLAKTADHAKLARAEEMAADGLPREQIWKDTGWFQGVDGKWRFEIDDSGVKFDPSNTLRPGQGWDEISQVLDHPKLYEAYPGLENTTIERIVGRGGLFHPRSVDYPDGLIRVGGEGRDATSSALHEMQHAGPQRYEEGFAKGSTPERAFGVAEQPRLDAIRAEKKALGIDPYAIQNRMAGGYPVPHDLLSVLRKWNDLTSLEDSVLANALSPHEAYLRHAGEVEARTVQTRRDLSPEDRSSRPPWLDYDVPESQQIVRFGDKGPQMSSESPLPMDQASRMERARELGFDTDRTWYHGTGRTFDEFDLSSEKVTGGGLNDQGVFVTSDPKVASRYAEDFGGDSPSVMPLYSSATHPLPMPPALFNRLQKVSGQVRRGEPISEIDSVFLQDDLAALGVKWDGASHPIEAIKSAGFDAIDKDAGRYGLSEQERMIFDPSHIRSVNAAFDPTKADSSNLLARYSSPSAADYDTLLRANEAGHAPKPLPERPFTDDYRSPIEGMEGNPLKTDIEGRPLDARFVAGRRTIGGRDEGLDPEAISAIAQEIGSVNFVPRSELPRRAVGSYTPSINEINIAADLPADQRLIALSHELGHGLADSARTPIDLEGSAVAGRKVYHDLRTGDTKAQMPRQFHSPELDGYAKKAVGDEIRAELLRAYMMDPNYVKTVAPKAAKAIRDSINSDPWLSKIVQFNTLAGAALAPAAIEDLLRQYSPTPNSEE